MLFLYWSEVPRNLEVKGRNLNGIHFAMDFLSQQNDMVVEKQFQKIYLFQLKEKSVYYW